MLCVERAPFRSEWETREPWLRTTGGIGGIEMVVGGREMTNVTQRNETPASTHCPIFVRQSTDHFLLVSTFIDATHRSTLPSIPTHCLRLPSKADFDFASAPERFLCLGTWLSEGWHRTWIFFHETMCTVAYRSI
jgi:hypothetical protein